MKPWFEADIIKFPVPQAKVIQMPNVQEYPDFITGVQDLQAKQKDGKISQESYDKLYAELIHRFMKKESFDTPWFLREDARTELRKYIQNIIQTSGIKQTPSSRGGLHIRFPLAGDEKDFQKYFQNVGITVGPNTTSISGTFDTFLLTLTEPVGNIPAGTQLPWVNNYVGRDSKIKKTFGAKEFTPDSLSLANARADQQKILLTIDSSIKENYAEYHKPLMEIAKRSTHSGTSISLGGIDLSVFTPSDIATISKNYGEVLSGLWSISNLEFENVYFPQISNAKMIDFYGEKDKIDYPVSVKSGAGGKVTISNILDALQDKVREGKVNPAEQKSYIVFKTVKDNGTKQGILKLHAYFQTDPIKQLAQLMKTTVDEVNLDTINEWLNGFENNDRIKEVLDPWLKSMNTQITDSIWQRDDRLRFVISPIGEWLYRYLNSNEEIRGSMTELARQLSIIQVNIDIKKSLLIFQYNKFSKAEFMFGWAGYTAGNKLGFKMNLN
jgi:hypothetical protein